jgi:hypothetical protein
MQTGRQLYNCTFRDSVNKMYSGANTFILKITGTKYKITYIYLRITISFEKLLFDEYYTEK